MDARAGTTPLIVVVGETASGKSVLALELAERYKGEIICADALTVRRGVDIGTAKPTPADRTRIPHHLIDIVAPCEDFTAAVFKDKAKEAVEYISAAAHLPILVGGTGLYVDAVLYDYSFLPAGNRVAREALNRTSLPDLLNQAKDKGLDTSKIDTSNKRRVIRLLETGGQTPSRSIMRPNTLMLGVRLARERLDDRITQRIDAMLNAGLEQEVKLLAEKLGWSCEALKGIGYKEWHDYFEGSQTLEQTKQKIIKSTRELAKRQRTWFKRNNSIHWVSNSSEAVDITTTFLNKKDK